MKLKFLIAMSLMVTALMPIESTQADSRIVGGVDATPGNWPWMVELHHTGQNNYNGLFCGGSLIAADWVVTAAHCVVNETTNSFDIVANVTNLKQDIGQKRAIKRLIVHPSYNNYTQNFDIALIQLKTPIVNAKPIGLPAKLEGFTGYMATAIGWGNMASNTSFNFFPYHLQEVQIPIVSNPMCNEVFTQSSLDKATPNMLCAGYMAGGKDTCQGDSGGPLMVNQAGQWKLAGLVSYGQGCALPLTYGVYTKVSMFIDFINKYKGFNYFALADINHDGKVNLADKTVKQGQIQAQLKAYIQQCWLTAASCGDINKDTLIDWRDLARKTTTADREYQKWLTEIWQPEV